MMDKIAIRTHKILGCLDAAMDTTMSHSAI